MIHPDLDSETRDMSSAYDKLGRILLLERDQGFQDRAVIGGLTRFLTYWRKQADQETDQTGRGAPVKIVMDLLDGYREMGVDARARTVEQLLGMLTSGEQPEDAPKGPTADTSLGAPSSEPKPARAPTGEAHRGRPSTELPADARQGLGVSVTTLTGVKAVNQKRLARLGIETVRDLLYHLPRRHDDYGKLKTIDSLELGDEVTVVGVVRDVQTHRTRGGKSVVRVTLSDGTASVEANWFGPPYLRQRFRLGSEVAVSGRVEHSLGRLVFNSPQWEPLRHELLHTGRLVPVYALTKGIGARWLRRVVRNTLDRWVPRVVDPLPKALIESEELLDIQSALWQIHFPENWSTLARAQHRLCFDELLLLQLGILRHRSLWRSQRGHAFNIRQDRVDTFVERLPYTLTGAQQRAIGDILADLGQPTPMSRLLQGDVGSGKTIVAVVAMLTAVRNDLQVAMMAPTSILAEQHYRTVVRALEHEPDIVVALLQGSMSAGEKQRVRQQISSGDVGIVVGTHALIQETVDFPSLGLVVVDEQHRFGVVQRGALRAKGSSVQPHLLAMSATPIPRTLALTVYGDLDVSVVDELPPGREPIITAIRDRTSRERIYSFVRSQVAQGRQAFVVCPLVEESEGSDIKGAVAEHKRLAEEVFPGLRVGLLHGRMRAVEKDEIMLAFGKGLYDILVSTSVIEVGLDIPNASVIIVEGSERFGLAQLHQFRGRVGRGEHKSYCILLSDDPTEQGLERLAIMEHTNDGFVLAEKDLEMRGPGDFMGRRQHGLPELKVASLSDTRVLAQARRVAQNLLDYDPDLTSPDHAALAASVGRFWAVSELP